MSPSINTFFVYLQYFLSIPFVRHISTIIDTTCTFGYAIYPSIISAPLNALIVFFFIISTLFDTLSIFPLFLHLYTRALYLYYFCTFAYALYLSIFHLILYNQFILKVTRLYNSGETSINLISPHLISNHLLSRYALSMCTIQKYISRVSARKKNY